MKYTRDSISCCTCVKKSIIDISPRFSSEWRRTETVPFSTTRSHITSIHGIFLIPIITDLCIYSFATASTSTLSPSVFNSSDTPCVHAKCRSDLGTRANCKGASQTGKAPPKCSINTPMKRSIDPNNAL